MLETKTNEEYFLSRWYSSSRALEFSDEECRCILCAPREKISDGRSSVSLIAHYGEVGGEYSKEVYYISILIEICAE